VVIKWFRQCELLAGPALVLQDAYRAGRITIMLASTPAYEMANVLSYKIDISTEQVRAAVRSLFDTQMTWAPPLAGVMERATETARIHTTTIYDVTFATLTGALEATFVTADEWLARRLESLPFVRVLGELDLQAVFECLPTSPCSLRRKAPRNLSKCMRRLCKARLSSAVDPRTGVSGEVVKGIVLEWL
jgi:predicted nucleic acid-binding protein